MLAPKRLRAGSVRTAKGNRIGGLSKRATGTTPRFGEVVANQGIFGAVRDLGV